MKITHCKLKRVFKRNCSSFLYSKLPPVQQLIYRASTPIRQCCFTARFAKSSAIIFHWKPIRFLTAQLSWTRAILADTAKANVDAVRQTRWQFLVFSNAAARFIPWLLRTLKERRYFLLSQRKLCLTVLSIRIV